MKKLLRISGLGVSIVVEEGSETAKTFIARVIALGGIPDIQVWTKGEQREY